MLKQNQTTLQDNGMEKRRVEIKQRTSEIIRDCLNETLRASKILELKELAQNAFNNCVPILIKDEIVNKEVSDMRTNLKIQFLEFDLKRKKFNQKICNLEQKIQEYNRLIKAIEEFIEVDTEHLSTKHRDFQIEEEYKRALNEFQHQMAFHENLDSQYYKCKDEYEKMWNITYFQNYFVDEMEEDIQSEQESLNYPSEESHKSVLLYEEPTTSSEPSAIVGQPKKQKTDTWSKAVDIWYHKEQSRLVRTAKKQLNIIQANIDRRKMKIEQIEKDTYRYYPYTAKYYEKYKEIVERKRIILDERNKYRKLLKNNNKYFQEEKEKSEKKFNKMKENYYKPIVYCQKNIQQYQRKLKISDQVQQIRHTNVKDIAGRNKVMFNEIEDGERNIKHLETSINEMKSEIYNIFQNTYLSTHALELQNQYNVEVPKHLLGKVRGYNNYLHVLIHQMDKNKTTQQSLEWKEKFEKKKQENNLNKMFLRENKIKEKIKYYEDVVSSLNQDKLFLKKQIEKEIKSSEEKTCRPRNMNGPLGDINYSLKKEINIEIMRKEKLENYIIEIKHEIKNQANFIRSLNIETKSMNHTNMCLRKEMEKLSPLKKKLKILVDKENRQNDCVKSWMIRHKEIVLFEDKICNLTKEHSCMERNIELIIQTISLKTQLEALEFFEDLFLQKVKLNERKCAKLELEKIMDRGKERNTEYDEKIENLINEIYIEEDILLSAIENKRIHIVKEIVQITEESETMRATMNKNNSFENLGPLKIRKKMENLSQNGLMPDFNLRYIKCHHFGDKQMERNLRLNEKRLTELQLVLDDIEEQKISLNDFIKLAQTQRNSQLKENNKKRNLILKKKTQQTMKKLDKACLKAQNEEMLSAVKRLRKLKMKTFK